MSKKKDPWDTKPLRDPSGASLLMGFNLWVADVCGSVSVLGLMPEDLTRSQATLLVESAAGIKRALKIKDRPVFRDDAR